MQIKDSLLEPYFIEYDGMQYIVKKDTGRLDKNQKMVTENNGYFSSRFEALKKVADMKINNTDLQYSISQYFQEYNSTVRELIRVIGE